MDKNSSTKAPLIQTIGLKKVYRSDELETPVLHGIDLKINEGEFVAIMGPSGSGKSTLMHILGFLDQSTGGTYLFRGEPVASISDDQLAQIRATRVSFVFQAFNLLPRTSVLENVILPLLYHPTIPVSERRERALKAIDAVGLMERAEYFTNQLSGGQQQRVAIARALVSDPDVLFADEPTGNLDSASGKNVMEALQKLHDQSGKTIILVTHETATAQHAERIIHIKDGHIESDSRDFQRIIAAQGRELR
ncbi:ABC transporter ATP-binding protein [Candidatus Peregrinibacteria bacterium]|nr:ABC transporter ATP-binding protein [Candidatus Peregrinibacteria bacterium]